MAKRQQQKRTARGSLPKKKVITNQINEKYRFSSSDGGTVALASVLNEKMKKM